MNHSEGPEEPDRSVADDEDLGERTVAQPPLEKAGELTMVIDELEGEFRPERSVRPVQVMRQLSRRRHT